MSICNDIDMNMRINKNNKVNASVVRIFSLFVLIMISPQR